MTRRGIGDLELAALLSIARQGEEAYGASIRRDLSERARREYAIGAIYTTLQRLEDKGLIASRMSEPTPVRGGRARRCFRITAAGSRALAVEQAATSSMWEGVQVRPRTA